MRKTFLRLTVSLFLMIVLDANAQVIVTSSGGTPTAPYATVSAAFAAINSGTHQGTVLIEISGNTTEPAAPVSLLANGQSGASYTSIVIRPTATATISGAPTAGFGVLMLDGADNVTIDGSITPGGTTRDLTIRHTAIVTQANTAAIRLIGRESTGGLGTNHITIRNTNIFGSTPGNNGSSGSTVTTSYGIYAGSSVATTMSATGVGFNYDNLTIENNAIRSAYTGIYVTGSPSPDVNDNLVIRGNDIGSVVATEGVSFRGILAAQHFNAVITGNTIHDMVVSPNISIAGIEADGDGSFNTIISHNRVYNIQSTSASGYGANGIMISAGTQTLVHNNVIYGIATTNFSSTSITNQAAGIRISGATNSVKIYYNSVNMYGHYGAGSAVLGRSAALVVGVLTATGLDIRNNIFANKMTSNANAQEFLAVWFVANYNFYNAQMNNNAYMVPNDGQHYVAKVGTTAGTGLYSNLGSFLPVSQYNNPTNNNASIPNSNGVAPFTADNDLTIPAGIGTGIESGGVFIPLLGSPNVDHVLVNRPAFGGTAPDMGAYEFDGVALTTDVGVTQLLAPSANGCFSSTDSVTFRVQNLGIVPISLSTNPITVNAYTTGANPVTFPPVVINTGTFLPGASLDVTVSNAYAMNIAGTHVFHAGTVVAGDVNTINDTITPVTRIVSAGTATVSSDNICNGNTVSLSLSGQSAGTSFQWQSSTDGISWNNLTGGAISPFVTLPSASPTYYRALVCGSLVSVIDTVSITTVAPPLANNVTRCGPGTATLTATGSGTLEWYNAPAGGAPIATGNSYTTPYLTSGATYYVSEYSGSGFENMPSPNAAGSSFHTNTIGWGLRFTVNASATISSVDIFAGSSSPGPASIQIRVTDLSDNILFTSPVYNFNATGTITQHTVPVAISLPPGQYKMGMVSTNITSLIRETSVSGFPYTSATNAVSITAGANGAGGAQTTSSYYWFYNWVIGGGCYSARVPVDVILTPSDTIIATPVDSAICTGSSTMINVASVNNGYTYSWSPSAELNASTGSSVIFTGSSTTTFTINATDTVTGCGAITTTSVLVSNAPGGSLTVASDTICALESNTLIFKPDTMATFDATALNVPVSFTIPTSLDTIQVSGVPYPTLSTGDIEKVCLDITHPNDADLDIFLISPSGTLLELSTDNGGTGDHYNNTCFDMNAPIAITSGAAPFNGSFIPEGAGGFDVFNGEATNGNWILSITDDLNSNDGTLNSWSISFRQSVPTFSWSSIPAGFTSTSDTVTVNPSVTTTYVVTINNPSGACNAMVQETVHVNANPVADLGSDTVFCSNGLGVTIDGTTPGVIAYEWHDNSTAPTLYVDQTGPYILHVTDANGCVDTDTIIVSEVNPVQVNISSNFTTSSTAVLDAGAGFTDYLWSTGATSQTITVTANGVYSVSVTDANGCASTISSTIIFTLGINEDGSQATVSYFPNPSQGAFSIAIDGNQSGQILVEITDVNGRLVHSERIEGAAESFVHPISLNAAAGTYMVRVSSKAGMHTGRIIITE